MIDPPATSPDRPRLESGATAVEYALMLALISAALLLVVSRLGAILGGIFNGAVAMF